MIKKKKKKKLLIFIKRSIKIGQRKKDKRNLKINFPDYKPLSYFGTLHIIIHLVVQVRQPDEKEEPKEISTLSPVVTGPSRQGYKLLIFSIYIVTSWSIDGLNLQWAHIVMLLQRKLRRVLHILGEKLYVTKYFNLCFCLVIMVLYTIRLSRKKNHMK